MTVIIRPETRPVHKHHHTITQAVITESTRSYWIAATIVSNENRIRTRAKRGCKLVTGIKKQLWHTTRTGRKSFGQKILVLCWKNSRLK
jgi:hypothetical protein